MMNNETGTKPWKQYLISVAKTMLILYAATFGLALFIAHRGEHWVIPAVIIGMLYLGVFIYCIKRIIQTLPMAGLMIAAPTLPLVLLLMVLSLLPVFR
jgi:hypothetical protein